MLFMYSAIIKRLLHGRHKDLADRGDVAEEQGEDQSDAGGATEHEAAMVKQFFRRLCGAVRRKAEMDVPGDEGSDQRHSQDQLGSVPDQEDPEEETKGNSVERN